MCFGGVFVRVFVRVSVGLCVWFVDWSAGRMLLHVQLYG